MSVSFFHVLDVLTGESIYQAPSPTPQRSDEIAFFAFTADGSRLVTRSGYGVVTLWDAERMRRKLAPAPKPLDRAALDKLWADLEGDDAGKAARAIKALAASPKDSLPFLRQKLQPAGGKDYERIAQLIADLDDDSFEVREKASARLADLHELAAPAIREALKTVKSVEARRRLEDLAAKAILPRSGARLRTFRALELLERVGNAEAVKLLEVMAKGAPVAAETLDAKASLERLRNAKR